MRILIIAGFLGSGKTTLILGLAQALVRAGQRVAIIENEAGRAGIDGTLLSGAGLQVREIYAGCVCCSLRGDLLSTLQALQAEVKPDLVLVEPSGVAAPAQVRDVFGGSDSPATSITLTVLVDAARYDAILRGAGGFFFSTGLAAADVLAINKVDAVSAADLARIQAALREANPNATQLPISALAEQGLDALAATLLARSGASATAIPATSADFIPAPGAAEPTDKPAVGVHALEHVIAFPDPLPPAQGAPLLVGYLTRLGAALQAAGCPQIGHLKALFGSPAGGYVFASLTKFGDTPRARGALNRPHAQATFRLNVLVLGMDAAEVAAVVADVPLPE